MQVIPVGAQIIGVGPWREYVCVLPWVEIWTPAAFASEGDLLAFLPLLLSGFLMGRGGGGGGKKEKVTHIGTRS